MYQWYVTGDELLCLLCLPIPAVIGEDCFLSSDGEIRHSDGFKSSRIEFLLVFWRIVLFSYVDVDFIILNTNVCDIKMCEGVFR